MNDRITPAALDFRLVSKEAAAALFLEMLRQNAILLLILMLFVLFVVGVLLARRYGR